MKQKKKRKHTVAFSETKKSEEIETHMVQETAILEHLQRLGQPWKNKLWNSGGCAVVGDMDMEAINLSLRKGEKGEEEFDTGN